MSEPLAVNASDAAVMLGMSRSFFYQQLSSGRIPLKPIRIGAKRLFSVELLREYVRAGCPAEPEWQGGSGG